MKNIYKLIILIFWATFLYQEKVQSQHSPILRLKTVISLPGVEGRIDHMDIDIKMQRVFIAAIGNNTIEVVNIREGKRIHSLRGFKEPQGILFLPEFNQLFVTNGGNGTCAILDATSFKRLKTIESLKDADNIRNDKSSKLVYVGYGTGGLAIINPSKTEITYSLPINQHPESFQLETSGNNIYVNVPAENKIIVLDKVKREMVTSWSLKEGDMNFPMALDESNHQLFIGCRNPARLLVLDTQSGKLTSTISIGEEVDDVFLDSQRHLLYISCGQGVIDILSQETPNCYKHIAKMPTRAGARTCIFVPTLNMLIVAAPQSGEEEAQLRIYSINTP